MDGNNKGGNTALFVDTVVWEGIIGKIRKGESQRQNEREKERI